MSTSRKAANRQLVVDRLEKALRNLYHSSGFEISICGYERQFYGDYFK